MKSLTAALLLSFAALAALAADETSASKPATGPATMPASAPASMPASTPAGQAATSQPASAGDATVDQSNDYLLIPLPKEAINLAGGDKDLARIGEALNSAPAPKMGKAQLRVVDKEPFAAQAQPTGLVADTKTPQVVVSMNKSVQYVYVLFAVLDAGKDPLAQLTILREDGVPTRLKFVIGENAAPSIGAWEGKLQPKKGVPGKVTPVLETKAKDGTPVRLLLLEWRNDNEWYNVTDLKFKLLDDKAKTRLVVLGATGANAKKK